MPQGSCEDKYSKDCETAEGKLGQLFEQAVLNDAGAKGTARQPQKEPLPDELSGLAWLKWDVQLTKGSDTAQPRTQLVLPRTECHKALSGGIDALRALVQPIEQL